MKPVPLSNPPNPWATTEVEYLDGAPEVRLEVYEDHTRQILSKNDSPDVGFTWSVNPYRGCFHACAYCYARPSHEYLSWGAGTDFDRKIVVKPEAPALLRAAFAKRTWKKETVMFSGVTDCYQPLEASYRLTRGCLEVCVESANPAGVITKSPLIERDIEVLAELARVASVHVSVSIPIWDPDKARAIEPYVATPLRRIHIIEKLARAGIEVGRQRRAGDSRAQRPGHAARDDRGARGRRHARRLRASAPAGLGQGGVRGAAARESTACRPSASCTASARPAAARSTIRASRCAGAARGSTPRRSRACSSRRRRAWGSRRTTEFLV